MITYIYLHFLENSTCEYHARLKNKSRSHVAGELGQQDVDFETQSKSAEKILSTVPNNRSIITNLQMILQLRRNSTILT